MTASAEPSQLPPPGDAAPAPGGGSGASKRVPRIIRRKKKSSSTAADANELPGHIRNNKQLHHVIATTLPGDYEFEIPKTIWRIEKANATSVALQLPEGLTMYASTIGDILVGFAHRFRPLSSAPSKQDGKKDDEFKAESNGDKQQPKEIKSLSVLGDVTYGACCVDDLSARALGCDLLVHYGHSCLVPLTCTVIPCLYVFVEIRVDVKHLVECARLTFLGEESSRREEHVAEEDGRGGGCPERIIEALVMGTVQFRSAVVESAQRLNDDQSESDRVRFQAIVPQAKPLSPGEVLGCTAPSGLAAMDFKGALSKSRRRQARKNQASVGSAAVDVRPDANIQRERVMIFLADGRFHLEAAMIANPSLRALRYDPYSKTLTEERYETNKMRRLRGDAISQVRRMLGVQLPARRMDIVGGTDAIADGVLGRQLSSSMINTSANVSAPVTVGIILGTLGRQGNPAVLSRIRSLLRSRGVRSMIVLLSEIFPAKLEKMSIPNARIGGVCAWVQVACPRLSVDWGHHFRVPVLSPFELYVALGEVEDPSLWSASSAEEKDDGQKEEQGYPMDFYSNEGGPWANYYGSNRERKIASYGS